MPARHPNKKGFTLIELLVVIAIIAILAAILFPVFAKARDRAKQSTCINNLKQFGVAFQTYYQDNDELFPNQTGLGRWGDNTGWSEHIYAQIKSFQVYRCPSDEQSNVSYAMNAACSNPAGTSTYAARRLSNVRDPAKTIQLCEAPGTGNKNFPIKLPAYPPLDASLNRYGESDLTTEEASGTKNQPDGVVYGPANGAGSVTLQAQKPANPMPIQNYRKLSGAYIGHLYFPGRHGGGNVILFVDSHVSYFQTWDKGRMTFNANDLDPN